MGSRLDESKMKMEVEKNDFEDALRRVADKLERGGKKGLGYLC